MYAFALTAAPKSDLLWNNTHCLWADYLVTTVAAKKDKEAVELVARARKQLPGDKAFATAAEWFERAGHKETTWEEGIAVLDRGLAVVPEGERKQLRAARSGFYRQWSQKCLDKVDFGGSVKALEAGFARDPDDKEIHAGIAYHIQEAMPRLGEKSVDAAVEHFQLLQKEFPKVAAVGDGGRQFARRAVFKLADAGQYEDALKRVDELTVLLPEKGQRAESAGDVYDAWGRKLAKEKDWEGALAKFVEGLKVCPKHEWLGNNAVATVDEWAGGPMKEKKWDDAIAVYDAGLKLFPNSDHLKHNKGYCEAMKAKEQKVAKGK